MKICISHFRTGLTDGVSLQIDERAKILGQFGHKVYFISDPNSPNSDLRIPYFDYKKNIIIDKIQTEAFGGEVTEDIKELIAKTSNEIEEQLNSFWSNNKFSLIFIHNIFSLPVCLPATIAFYNFLQKHPQIKAVAVHHDFYWDPPRIEKFTTSSKYIKEIINKYLPPKLPNLSHTVLSIWEQRVLLKKCGINSEVVTDTFDYDQKLWQKDDSNKNYPSDIGLKDDDLVLLLASRIRPRKGIELGIEFCSNLSKVTSKNVVLVLPNDYSESEIKYVKLLKKKAEDLNVRILWIQDLVGSEDEKKLGIKKYSLWDCYLYTDAVLYPSLWEGFGNQFLEAVFAKKPIVYFEYPIFNTDLKPSGFNAISMGKVVSVDENGLATLKQSGLSNATKSLLKILNDKIECRKQVENNFRVAKRRFNTRVQIRKYLTVSSERYIRSNGVRTIISPLILAGKLVTCGILPQQSYDLAETIISEIPEGTFTNNDYFKLIVNNLEGQVRRRFITIEVMKTFFNSPKSKKPLFIFIGGLAGKTLMSNFIIQQLGINQAISLDNEKLRIANKGTSKSYLWKATYESPEGYFKTINDMYPFILEKVKRCMFDYSRYKKWSYLVEGIYLSPEILGKLQNEDKNLYYLNIFNLPKYNDIKNQYLIRWQNELGVAVLKQNKNTITQYLNNIKTIRKHLTKKVDTSSFIIESTVFEERLSMFYSVLYEKLTEISNIEIPGWISKIDKDPSNIKKYISFLN